MRGVTTWLQCRKMRRRPLPRNASMGLILVFLVLLAVLAGVWLARRVGGSFRLDSRASARSPEPQPFELSELPAPTGAALLRTRLDSLARALPEAAVDSPLLVALADLYDHEPVDE